MPTIRQLGYVLFVSLTLASCGNKEQAETLPPFHDYLTRLTELYRFNGNVLVAEKGKVVFQGSYGWADFTRQRPLNDSSVFELASVSKQFTAMAILLLSEQGKLKLTDSLRQYFPELPYSGITLKHMLVHTSGLPDYEQAMNKKWDRSKVAFNNDMIGFLAREKPPVLFSPGSKWEYSNTAYAILASIVEKQSGQRFQDFLNQYIFQPLGMTHTRIYNTRRSLKDTIPNYAFGWIYNDSTGTYSMPDSILDLNFVYYLDGIQGDGTVNSTTADLLKWDRAVKTHSLISEPLQKEMLAEQAIVDTAGKAYYGYGVFMQNTELGYNIAHSGGWPGYVTYLARNVDKDQTFIVLSNNSSASPSIANALQHLLNGKPVELPSKHTALPQDTVHLKTLTGQYKDEKTSFRINVKEGQLIRVNSNGQEMTLTPESATSFFYADGSNRQLQFMLDASGKPVKARAIVFGVAADFNKVE